MYLPVQNRLCQYYERERQRGREAEKQRGRETERQRDRETERQRERDGERLESSWQREVVS